ncbi:MAG TPA: methyltransferase [Deltaproteobacteria bacterium]|nr:methyltransferase [Deltaproteobacteria bacterium]HIJ41622.1 methyltransferase [Deltaproteobacteria bacterium]
MARNEWNAGALLGLSGSYWETCTLHAAVKLDLFSSIEEGNSRSEQITERSGLHLRGVTTLLNALAAMGLLVKSGEVYANVEASRSLLVKSSPRYLGHMIMHHHHLVEAWSRLDQSVRSGNPVGKNVTENEAGRESFLMGMFNLAMGIAPLIAKEIDLTGRKHLLDLGGGPGTYAIHFCLENPTLKATIADLSTTRPFAEKTVGRFNLSDRIDFVPSNYLEDDLEGQYDVAWLSHILHGEGPDGCRTIIEKAASVLEKGGNLFVHDFILDDNSDGPLFPAIFSLNMLVNTKKGRSYTENQIKTMLIEAGLHAIERLSYRGPNESGILVARKPF